MASTSRVKADRPGHWAPSAALFQQACGRRSGTRQHVSVAAEITPGWWTSSQGLNQSPPPEVTADRASAGPFEFQLPDHRAAARSRPWRRIAWNSGRRRPPSEVQGTRGLRSSAVRRRTRSGGGRLHRALTDGCLERCRLDCVLTRPHVLRRSKSGRSGSGRWLMQPPQVLPGGVVVLFEASQSSFPAPQLTGAMGQQGPDTTWTLAPTIQQTSPRRCRGAPALAAKSRRHHVGVGLLRHAPRAAAAAGNRAHWLLERTTTPPCRTCGAAWSMRRARPGPLSSGPVRAGDQGTSQPASALGTHL